MKPGNFDLKPLVKLTDLVLNLTTESKYDEFFVKTE